MVVTAGSQEGQALRGQLLLFQALCRLPTQATAPPSPAFLFTLEQPQPPAPAAPAQLHLWSTQALGDLSKGITRLPIFPTSACPLLSQ